eukprot:scaffold92309_cov21-Tisochrysis_lutea.AAC.1
MRPAHARQQAAKLVKCAWKVCQWGVPPAVGALRAATPNEEHGPQCHLRRARAMFAQTLLSSNAV